VGVRELRLQTGLSQSKFAKMFDVPVATLKDWEQERRNPPAYVINMMRTILQYKGMLISQSYVEACEARRKSVENAMAIMLSATNGPDELFLEVLDSYIFGKITLEEMENRIDRFEYLKKIISDALQGEVQKSEYSMNEEQTGEQYKIAKADYEAFREKYSIKKD